ncbi:MAG: hypothetical protein NTV86_18840 [Planctomycetota bacterium]|nr:hypothetical protein [Planctomycetota bacterium]
MAKKKAPKRNDDSDVLETIKEHLKDLGESDPVVHARRFFQALKPKVSGAMKQVVDGASKVLARAQKGLDDRAKELSQKRAQAFRRDFENLRKAGFSAAQAMEILKARM